MLIKWIKENKSLAYKITGANFLVMTLVLLFWSQPKAVMSENEKAAARAARMEARVQRVSSSSSSSSSSSTSVMKAYKENQEQQLRIVLILMAIFGTGFMVYGFIQKPKDKE